MRRTASVSGEYQIVEDLQRVLEPVIGKCLVRVALRPAARFIGQTDLDD